MTRPHYLADEVRARLARYEKMAAELVALRAALAAAQSRVAALEEIVRLLMREGHKITDPDAPTLGWADAVCAARAALATPPPHDGEGAPEVDLETLHIPTELTGPTIWEQARAEGYRAGIEAAAEVLSQRANCSGGERAGALWMAHEVVLALAAPAAPKEE